MISINNKTRRLKTSKRARNKAHGAIKEGFSFVDTTHVERFARLNEGRSVDSNYDIVLLVDGVRIPAHRCVLMASSDYFKSMFTISMKESLSSEIPLVDMNGDAAKCIIDFMYTGHLNAKSENIQDLVVVSDMLQVLSVKDACANYLSNHIDVSNCLEMWEFARQFNCHCLDQKCLKLINGRIGSLIQMDSFLTISAESLHLLLKQDNLRLGADGEVMTAKAILEWSNHDLPSRICYAKMLFSEVRWNSISSSQLQMLQHAKVLDKNGELKEILEECVRVSSAPERCPLQRIIAAGGYFQSRTGPFCPRLNTAELLILGKDSWERFESLPVNPPSFIHLLVLQSGRILSICMTSKRLSDMTVVRDVEEVYELDPVDETWLQVDCGKWNDVYDVISTCHLQRGVIFSRQGSSNVFAISHSKFNIIHFNGCDTPYVDGSKSSPVIEEFQNSHRIDMGGAVCDSFVYCFGGARKDSEMEMYPAADMFRLDLKSVQPLWESRSPMNESRAKMASVEHDGCIYVFGGFRNLRLQTCEMYRPTVDQWTYLANMEMPRSHHTCVCAQNKIYVLGGKSVKRSAGARKVLPFCEVYDTRTNKWLAIPSLNQPRCLADACVL